MTACSAAGLLALPSPAAALTTPTILEPAPATTSGPAAAGPNEPPPAVTVTPAQSDPAHAGQWQVLSYTAPGLSIHATVLNTGRVLIVEGSGNNATQFAAGTFNVWSWDPIAGTFTLVPRLPYDLFCGGHALLADGRVLFVGGTASYPGSVQPFFVGLRTSYIYDPATGTFTRAPDMQHARWYPSALEQGDGSVLAVSGADETGNIVSTSERFNPSTGTWSALSNAFYFPWYPSLTLLADGRVFYAGIAATDSSTRAPGVWAQSTGAFTAAAAPQDPGSRDQGAAILLPPAQQQRVALFGGGNAHGTNPVNAVADTDIYNLSNPSAPVHSVGPPLAAPKMHVLGVILPDETVFETGGGLSYASQPVQEAAIYRPGGGTWSQMNPPAVPRTYHSEAVLLPDGRVATLGSNSNYYPPETRIEIFSPPYLFKGPRPAIASAPSAAGYGSTMPVVVNLPLGATLSKLVLVKPASVTHSVDPNQRLVELPFVGAGGAYAATVPSNPNVTPPGWYMLFAVDNQGRPSVASWVHIS